MSKQATIRSWFGAFITHQWYAVVAFWLLLAIVLRTISPAWDSVIHDGDFQFLPANSPSRVGQAVLRKAFPDDQSKSQMVVVFSTKDGAPTLQERCTIFDVARRLTFEVSKLNYQRWESGTEDRALIRSLFRGCDIRLMPLFSLMKLGLNQSGSLEAKITLSRIIGWWTFFVIGSS